jgi:hypothetical protein
LGRQDLILIVEILGLGIWSLRDYKSRSKESERHTLNERTFGELKRGKSLQQEGKFANPKEGKRHKSQDSVGTKIEVKINIGTKIEIDFLLPVQQCIISLYSRSCEGLLDCTGRIYLWLLGHTGSTLFGTVGHGFRGRS